MGKKRVRKENATDKRLRLGVNRARKVHELKVKAVHKAFGAKAKRRLMAGAKAAYNQVKESRSKLRVARKKRARGRVARRLAAKKVREQQNKAARRAQERLIALK